MLPWIRPGDILFIREAAFEEVSRGEVVLYCRDGRLFVHRILTRIAGQGIVAGRKFVLTKGDALSQADAPLSSDELLGLVLEIHRGRRHWDCASSGYTALARFLARFSFLGRISYLFARATQMIFFSSRKSEADPSRAAASENQLGACEMTLASPLRD